MTTDKDQTIWERKNTAHITKMSIEGTVALASLAGAIAAILIATKVIAGPASLALIASPAGIAVLFIAAVYFAAAAYVSYQQMYAKGEQGLQGEQGVSGRPGTDANFADLVSDAVKSGTIVEETDGKGVKQLNLKLSKDDYQALTNGKNKNNDEVTLHVLLADKSVAVKFNHVAAANDNGNHKVTLTNITDKKVLEMADNSSSLKVAVSDKEHTALKSAVSTKLADVAVREAISKVKVASK